MCSSDLVAAARCDLLPLLPSGPDGVQRELAVRDLPLFSAGDPREMLGHVGRHGPLTVPSAGRWLPEDAVKPVSKWPGWVARTAFTAESDNTGAV